MINSCSSLRRQNSYRHQAPSHRRLAGSKSILYGRVRNSAPPPRIVRETRTTVQKSNNYIFSPGFGKIAPGGCGAFLDYPQIRNYIINGDAADQVEQLHGKISSEISENLVIYGRLSLFPELVFRGWGHFLHLREQFFHECNKLPDYYNKFRVGLYQQLLYPSSIKTIHLDDFPKLLNLLRSGYISDVSEIILIDQFSRYISFENMKKEFLNLQPRYISNISRNANLFVISHLAAGETCLTSGGNDFHYSEFLILLYDLGFRGESLYFDGCDSGSRECPRDFTPSGIRGALKGPNRSFAENTVIFANKYVPKNGKNPPFKYILVRAAVGVFSKYAKKSPIFQNMRVASNDDRSIVIPAINCLRRFTIDNIDKDITPPPTPPPHLTR